MDAQMAPACRPIMLTDESNKVLNWRGFMRGCIVDRTGATACRRGHQGASASTHTHAHKDITGASLWECTGVTGCNPPPQLQHTTVRLTEQASDSNPPSAIFSGLKAGWAQKSTSPRSHKAGKCKYVYPPKKTPPDRLNLGRTPPRVEWE